MLKLKDKIWARSSRRRDLVTTDGLDSSTLVERRATGVL